MSLSTTAAYGCSLCTRALLHLVSQIMQLHFQHDWFQSLPLEICSSCFIPFWVTFVQIKGEGHRQNYKNRKQWQSLPTEDKDRLCQDSQDRKFNYSSEPFSYNLLIWSKIKSSILIPNNHSMWHKMLSEQPVPLWRFPQSSIRPSKLENIIYILSLLLQNDVRTSCFALETPTIFCSPFQTPALAMTSKSLQKRSELSQKNVNIKFS